MNSYFSENPVIVETGEEIEAEHVVNDAEKHHLNLKSITKVRQLEDESEEGGETRIKRSSETENSNTESTLSMRSGVGSEEHKHDDFDEHEHTKDQEPGIQASSARFIRSTIEALESPLTFIDPYLKQPVRHQRLLQITKTMATVTETVIETATTTATVSISGGSDSCPSGMITDYIELCAATTDATTAADMDPTTAAPDADPTTMDDATTMADDSTTPVPP